MDDIRRLCVRLVGEPAGETAAAEAAEAAGSADRTAQLKAALGACRRKQAASGDDTPVAETGAGARRGLADAVAGELRCAVAGLKPEAREALALRDVLGLSYEDIAGVTEREEREDVALLLATARLALREQLRGPGQLQPECPERERALRTIASRQDEQPVAAADDDWLIEHLGYCRGCAQAHAAMLEAAACYRAWSAAESATHPPTGPTDPGRAAAAGAGQ